jgi:hypothetical protein
MDVGAGTGVLSLFAAKSGAKKVYAIEASGIATIAEKNIRENKMQDKIELLKGRVEHIELPEGVVVDCIVSEWMGYFLVFENMLDSVLFARDKWLRKAVGDKPSGVMAPSNSCIFLSMLSSEKRYDDLTTFYKDVYGLGMKHTLKALLSDVIVSTIDADELLDCEPQYDLIKDMDLGAIKREELKSIESDFSFTVKKDGPIHGFVGSFDTTFQGETTVVCFFLTLSFYSHMLFTFSVLEHFPMTPQLIGTNH